MANVDHAGTVVVEQTAKKYKAWMAASFVGAVVFMILGIVLATAGHKPIIPGVLAGVCLVSYLWAVSAAWWNHG